jgi:hypothetical protein
VVAVSAVPGRVAPALFTSRVTAKRDVTCAAAARVASALVRSAWKNVMLGCDHAGSA